jgi:DNA-binding response OmpR family regulator
MQLDRAFAEGELPLPVEPLPVAFPQQKRSRSAKPAILVADDDTVVRVSIAHVLEYEGFEVRQAENGIQAVTQSIQNIPDLALLDLNMPHWDGWIAFSQLSRVAPHLPVIVLTARPNQYENAVKMGVDAFMEKPLNFPILIRAIHNLINPSQNNADWREQKQSTTEWLARPAQ